MTEFEFYKLKEFIFFGEKIKKEDILQKTTRQKLKKLLDFGIITKSGSFYTLERADVIYEDYLRLERLQNSKKDIALEIILELDGKKERQFRTS